MKKCKCGKEYQQYTTMQTCCLDCLAAKVIKNRVRSEKSALNTKRRELLNEKERIKSRADWIKEAQQAFNAWTRQRDILEPCISCQRHHDGQYHAGHYRTTKAAPELRFCEINVWKQCSVCNNHLSGNILEYRIQLIKKGIDIDWLEGPHEPKKYTIDDLKAIKAEYKQKLKELLK